MRRLSTYAILFLALIVAAAGFASDADGVALSASSWDFGILDQGDTAVTAVSMDNTTDSTVAVTLLPTCDCLSIEPSRLQIQPGGTGAFRLIFDSESEKGEIVRTLLIRTDSPALPRALFVVRGMVREGGSSAKRLITLTYYYSPGCASCERFLAEEVPRLAHELDVEIEVRQRDVFAPGIFEEYERVALSFGVKELRAFPVLLVGNTTLLQGTAEIHSRLEATLRATLAPASAARAPVTVLAVLPVLAGGLHDGVNPCAFTTLIFLLTALALAGRGRREVLMIGGLFSLAVFATYFAVSLGFFTALRAASAFSLVSRVIRWVLVGVLVASAALSARDAFLANRGRATQMVLQLPKFLKRRIHASIRGWVHSTTLMFSSLALGFLVSVFEFACTGQVDVPTLAYLSRLGQIRALLLLVVYNLGLIAPLLAVCAASYAGVTSQRITVLFQRYLVAVKVAFAVFFLALAALTFMT